ncbi:saxitoxin and tetrodotoxin-binding protein 1-like isoform X2 [Phyllopteryx taeniolatus]|uniref:saxitoxin and tetrodotoxin-binding protein 1-like isoform X2 n=1 Tax=Phyllopteryx taeniolatus TaxID=161469 RepID=UPI002AD48673|nr:saxitoxin and tetrodotoxin-binding protein 1-like isoform X2 [Phyllopteryx taeniolatus]
MKMVTTTMMTMMMITMMMTTTASGALAQLPRPCDALYKPLPTKHLDQVFGEWRLHWGAAEFLQIDDLAHSHVSLRPKREIVHLLERNKYRDHSCVTYSLNVTAPADPTTADPLILPAVIDRVVSNGSLLTLNVSFMLHFYERSSEAMLMFVEAGEMGHFLLSYTRAGHRVDSSQLEVEHEKLARMVACLSFTPGRLFIYDGKAVCAAESTTDE